jgi:hypothetical protein
MIPLISTTKIDMEKFSECIGDCHGQLANRGPNERRLCALLEAIVGFPMATAANATVALQLLQAGKRWHRPAFTFPATNLGQRCDASDFVQPHTEGPLVGFSPLVFGSQLGQVVTVPFGCDSSGRAQGNGKPLLVDAAACASPSMHIVKEWLEAGAQAVVVSLHATKIWPAGEGAFVAFQLEEDREVFQRRSNFGIQISHSGARHCCEWKATNAKLSEFGAAAALASWPSFLQEWKRREPIVEQLERACLQHGVPYIRSRQTFWLAPATHWTRTVAAFARAEVEARNYYWDTPITPHSELSERGVCIPTHSEAVPSILNEVLRSL